MGISGNDFRAWYYSGANGESKIGVVGKVIAIDGNSHALIRAVPQGINPRLLMLKIKIEPYAGVFHPHIACEEALRYDEISENGAFTDVHIEGEGGSFTIKVGV
ncbi:hypothetical protein [Acidithiobacillus sulfuriphilus]|uniref:hypothetical protein n=1 Tax=Acidithiobacillus sulfuriphilus TaxID=1867749 RepID=UPI003F63DCCB